MFSRISFAVLTPLLLLVAQPSFGGIQPVGVRFGAAFGAVLPDALGGALPFAIGIGGVTAVAALALVIGIQVIRRKKK